MIKGVQWGQKAVADAGSNKQITKEIKKQIASIEGANSIRYAFGPTTITYNKLKIGKNENGNQQMIHFHRQKLIAEKMKWK